jgi:DNA-nicking Smr family endonuclease
MGRKSSSTPPPVEDALFRDAVGSVRPVRTRRVALEPPAPPATARFSRADDAAVLAESLSRDAPEVGLESGDELNFSRAGISTATLRELRRGKYRIQDELDLHGLTAKEAKEALLRFMADALGRRLRCVRIIHGKGLRSGARGPVLKVKLNKWLAQWDSVLAFVSAPQRDGGTGAVYVLLRR